MAKGRSSIIDQDPVRKREIWRKEGRVQEECLEKGYRRYADQRRGILDHLCHQRADWFLQSSGFTFAETLQKPTTFQRSPQRPSEGL